MNPHCGRVRRWVSAIAVLVLLFPVASQARTVKLLVFGDSLTAGYGLAEPDAFQAQLAAALKKDGRDVQIQDGGVSGDTTAGARSRLDWVLADKPDAALVEFGGNDGLRGIDPHDMQTNLTAILNEFDAKHIPVLLSGMLAPPNLGGAYSQQFAAVFAQLGKRPGLMYDPFFLAGVAGNPALNQADHIHPNPAGVKIIVARLTPLVEKLLDKAGAE